MWYGVSYKPGDRFSGQFKKFESEVYARSWLDTDQGDFRQREIFDNKQDLIKEYSWLNTSDDPFETVIDDILG